MDDARAEVSGRVDGVAGRTTERQTDPEHEERNRQRPEGAEGRAAEPILSTMATMPNTSMKVPMISVIRFATVLRIAGPVENTASLSPGSSVSPQWAR